MDNGISSVEIFDLDKEVVTFRLEPPKGWNTCNLNEDKLLITLHNYSNLISITLNSFNTLQNQSLPISDRKNVMSFSSCKM
jgi:hypothetical protein